MGREIGRERLPDNDDGNAMTVNQSFECRRESLGCRGRWTLGLFSVVSVNTRT